MQQLEKQSPMSFANDVRTLVAGNQIAEAPESAYQDLIDRKIHPLRAPFLSRSKNVQKQCKMYFLLDIRKTYKIDYRDIIMIGKSGITKLLVFPRGEL